ncbi:NAD(P)-binding protein [Wilcoxina mikolae CBS 423.85]|nr:NAD(P)-binding protein [Wilcoxina mikolae CBS 423.85]
MSLFRKNQMPVAGRLVVVTGGSQGMGKSVAILLAKRGASIVIVARNQERLDTALEEIRAAALNPTQKFLAVSADLTSGAETDRAFEEIKAALGVPDIVWQCAGGTLPGYFKDYSSAELEREMHMNYFTALHTAHASIRFMNASPLAAGAQKRHIIFTSSVLAFYPIAGYNAYSPAKAAIRSLADGLRQECLLYDIDVHACFPATIYTPGFEEEQKTKPELTKILEGGDEGQTPEQVAEICLRKLEKGQTLVTTTLMGSAIKGGAWAGSPRGNVVLDTLFGWVLLVVWVIVGKVMDWEVVKYRKKLAKEGRTV